MRRIFRYVVIGVDAVILVLFVLGYLGRYLHPRYFWWMDLIAVGLPYTTMLLGLATLAVILMGRWRLVAVHVVLLVFGLIRFVPAGRFAPESPQPDDLILLTYNMSHWWQDDRSLRARRMRELVGESEPALITLQEARLQLDRSADGSPVRALPHVRILIDSLQYAMLYPEGTGSTYIAQPVLARRGVKLLDQSRIELQHEDRTPFKSVVLRTVFRWEGREAVLYNVHLRSFGDVKPWEDQAVRALDPTAWWSYFMHFREAYLDRAWEVRQIKKRAAAESLPVLIVGDFNSTMHSWVYAHVSDRLNDAFLLAGRGWGATYHTYWPLVRIDFAMVDPAFEIVRADVLDVALSDHRPLLVRLRWREQ